MIRQGLDVVGVVRGIAATLELLLGLSRVRVQIGQLGLLDRHAGACALRVYVQGLRVATLARHDFPRIGRAAPLGGKAALSSIRVIREPGIRRLRNVPRSRRVELFEQVGNVSRVNVFNGRKQRCPVIVIESCEDASHDLAGNGKLRLVADQTFRIIG